MKLELSEQEINQLMVFLNRVNLQGNEAITFLQLVQKIQRQVQSQQIVKLPKTIEKPNKKKLK